MASRAWLCGGVQARRTPFSRVPIVCDRGTARCGDTELCDLSLGWVLRFPRNFVFQAGMDRIGEMEGWNIQDAEAGIHRGNQGAGDTPALCAASLLEHPSATACQNGRRSDRCSTGGRPGERIFARPDRSAPHFLVPINTSDKKVLKVLRRWVEFTQYASGMFQDTLAEFGTVGSMSRKGNCWDNVPTESFFNSLKDERVHGTRYATHDEARADLFDGIEVFYNRSRRHSALGYVAPTPFLQHWITAQAERKLVA